MFRAVICSSSGGQIVLLQIIINGRTVGWSGRTVGWSGLLYGPLQRVTISDAVIIQFDLLKISVVLLETCRGL